MSVVLESFFVRLVSSSIIISLVCRGAFCQTIKNTETIANLPDGYIAYPNINAAFKLHRERRSWTDAKGICEREGGHLAAIDTRTKLGYIREKKPRFSEVWVGFTKEDSGWIDINGNSRQADLPWQTNSPDSLGACAAVNVTGDGLCNKLCIWRKAFVCQRGLSSIR